MSKFRTNIKLSMTYNDLVSEMESLLREHLEKGRPWERLRTSQKGIFIVKMPERKYRPATLAIELNPADESGKPTKKRGVFIRNKVDFDTYTALISQPELKKLLKALEKINPKEEEKEEKVVEI